jgi:hypothetical protein
LAENIEAENSYDVGYRKPPPAGRFAKGRSGNPTGRPKGAKNLASIIIREGNQRVQVNGPKGTRTITKNEAVVMQLANQAAKGNLPATRLYLPLIQSIEQSAQMVRRRCRCTSWIRVSCTTWSNASRNSISLQHLRWILLKLRYRNELHYATLLPCRVSTLSANRFDDLRRTVIP